MTDGVGVCSGRPNPLPLNAQPMPCQKGDVMGIGLEFDTRGQMASGMPRRVYFVRNGEVSAQPA